MLVPERIDLGAINGRVVTLINLIGWEIRDVGVAVESRFEGRADGAELIPDYTVEEGVVSNLGATKLAGACAQTVVGVTE